MRAIQVAAGVALAVLAVWAVARIKAAPAPPPPPGGRCAGVSCAGDARCDPASGACVCGAAGARCPPGWACRGGLCVGPPPGLLCPDGSRPDPATGACAVAPLPCPALPCPPGAACDAASGRCVAARGCAGGCPPGQVCDAATGACFDPRTPKTVTVRNYCGRDMLLRFTAQQPWPPPLDAQLLPLAGGATVTVKMPCPSVSGRIYFYPGGGAKIDPRDNGETSYAWLEYNNDAGGILGANLTYVDHIALPYSYRLTGGDCDAGAAAACRTKLADLDIAGNCPPGLLKTSPSGVAMCLSPRTYCDNPAYAGEAAWQARCTAAPGGAGAALMAQLAACCQAGACAGWMCDPAAKVAPHHIWACEGGPPGACAGVRCPAGAQCDPADGKCRPTAARCPATPCPPGWTCEAGGTCALRPGFSGDSPRCAMFQRGLFAPGTRGFAQADPDYFARGCVAETAGLYECQGANFYRAAPFSDYCAWLHSDKGCPGNYCQPYDDQGGLGGYHACRATGIEITLCEGDAPPGI